MEKLSTIIYPELSYKLTGILFNTHNELGRFCNEKQYGDFLESCLNKFNMRYEREKIVPSAEEKFPDRNRIDFLIENKIILEIKAKRIIGREEYYQTRRYLAATNKKLGMIVNFRDKYLKPKRILNSSAKE